MAYDVTALRTAIAQGKVDEAAATQLIAEQAEWETKVAKLLDSPKQEEVTPVVEAQPVADTQPEVPAEAAQPETPPAQEEQPAA